MYLDTQSLQKEGAKCLNKARTSFQGVEEGREVTGELPPSMLVCVCVCCKTHCYSLSEFL